MAKQSDGGHHPNERLTVEGKNGQEEDGVGMEVECVEAIVVENSEEEAREWGHQPRVDVVHEEGEKVLFVGSSAAVVTRSAISFHSLSSLAVRRSTVWSFYPATQAVATPARTRRGRQPRQKPRSSQRPSSRRFGGKSTDLATSSSVGKRGSGARRRRGNESLAVGSTPFIRWK